MFGRNLELVGTAEAASEGTVAGADLLVRPDAARRGAARSRARHGGRAALRQRQGEPILPARLQPRPWHRLHDLRRRRAVEPALARPRAGLSRRQRLDARDRRAHRLSQGHRIAPTPATSRWRVPSSLRRSTGSTRRSSPLETGEDGWLRLAGGGTMELDDDATLTGLIEHKNYDGPWELQEGLAAHVGLGQYRRPTDFGTLAVTVSGYDGNWHPTEQIPERAIGTPSARTRSACSIRRPTAIRRVGSRGAQLEGEVWRASAYAQYYDWFMQSNPTYDFQINQFDDAGRRAAATSARCSKRDKLTLTAGGEFRYDDISNVGLDEFDEGEFVANISQNSIQETSLGVFIEASWSLDRTLARARGLRGRHLRLRRDGENAGQLRRGRDGLRARRRRSASRTRSATTSRSTVTGARASTRTTRAASSIPPTRSRALAPGKGYEAGARFELGALKITSRLLVARPRQRADLRRRLELRRAARRLASAKATSSRPSGVPSTGSASTPSIRAAVRATSTIPTAAHVEGSLEHAGADRRLGRQGQMGSEPARSLSGRVRA